MKKSLHRKKTLSVIVPIYNEEEVIHTLFERLQGVLSQLTMGYEIVFVNDGSSDSSLEKIEDLVKRNRLLRVICFSRNFGHQNAVIAGLEHCNGDCAVVIDADLQDPPELIISMLAEWEKGFHVVYGQRIRRRGESWFKKTTAMLFYRLLADISQVNIPINTGDFRLIDRKVIEVLKQMPEKNKFIRGMVAWVGFKQKAVLFERQERIAGKTKYPFRKMLQFAFTGIVSFSNMPLMVAVYLGFIVTIVSFLLSLYVVYLKLFTNATVIGWSSQVLAVLFMGGIQLLCIGILGLYIGKIINEVRGRPIYVIDKKINF